MSKVTIQGDNLFLRIRDECIPLNGDVEVFPAPEQPGLIVLSDGVGVYVDRDGEPCDENTVRFLATRHH